MEQSFTLAAEIIGVHSDCFVEGVGLSDCSCFQTRVGEIECFGRRGATEIRITDSDCKSIIICNETGGQNDRVIYTLMWLTK